MKRLTIITTLILVSASTAVSCGGGGSSGATTPGPAPSFTATFTADNPSPGGNTVALAPAPGGSGLVAVDVGVSGVNDVFAASFRVTYDPALVDFENWFAGSFLEQGSGSVLYQVNAATAGVVDVGIGCAGCATGLNASSTQNLVRLVFRPIQAGSSSLDFVAADLLDSSSPPAPIAGLTWFGGTVVAQ